MNTVTLYQTLIVEIVNALQDVRHTPEERLAWCLARIDTTGCWPAAALCPTCGALGVPCDLCDIPENVRQLQEWSAAALQGDVDLDALRAMFPNGLRGLP